MARSERPAITLADLEVYYRAIFMASTALKRPLAKIGPGAREALHVVDRYQTMVKEYRAAIEETTRMKQEQPAEPSGQI